MVARSKALWSRHKHPHVEAAHKYALDVIAGKIAACELVQQACLRFLKDLKRSQQIKRPFYFDPDKAEHFCRFTEKFPHVKGRQWAGQKLKLGGWQCFIYVNVFGFFNNDSNRRFRTVYIEVPRKNAKSTMSAPVGLYGLTADGEDGAEVYTAATMRDQAKIVFGVAQQMARKESGFRARFGVQVNTHNLSVLDTNSKFEPLSADAHTLDGLNVHIGIIDELHAHKTREVYDVIESAMGARLQPLLWLITTAGSDQQGICFEQRDYVVKLLGGIFDDDSYFGIIYTLDEDDDWTDPKVWAKANPNYGISVNPEMLAAHCRKALRSPRAQANFLTKYLDVWVNADTPWMDMIAWKRCANPKLKLEDFEKEKCIAAFDLASKVDIAARVYAFRRRVERPRKDGELETIWKYYLLTKFYLPEETIEETENDHYQEWVRSGALTANPGNIIDFETIEDDLIADAETVKIFEVPFDPFQATEFSTRLAKEGFTMVEMRATVQNFSEPMKLLEALVLSQQVEHDDNPVMNWMMSNVVCHTDKKDNIYPNKSHPTRKIDGAVAAIMAIGRWACGEGDGSTVYSKRGVRVL